MDTPLETLLATFIEVTLPTPDDFLKVAETLTRIGAASHAQQKLYQSCHILHKRGRYYIVHFKELFGLDGKVSTMTDVDYGRRNTIASLLAEWNLVRIVDPSKCADPRVPTSQIKIITHGEKEEWELIPKYSIGRKPKPNIQKEGPHA